MKNREVEVAISSAVIVSDGIPIMSQVSEQRSTLPTSLQLVYAPVPHELQETEAILRRELRNEHAYIDEMVR